MRKHHGPLRPTARQRSIQRLRAEIAKLQDEGDEDFAWWDPDTEIQLKNQSIALFWTALSNWFALEVPTLVDFHNIFFDCMLSMNIEDMKAARLFIFWIENELSDFVPEDDQVQYMQLLETAYMSVLEDLRPWALRLRYKELAAQLCHLEQADDVAPRPIRNHPQARRARQHPIETDYANMVKE